MSLHRALSILQRLLAPMLPFATEEVWSWWQTGSIHRASWPTSAEVLEGFNAAPDAVDGLNAICLVLGAVRRTKTEAKVSQRAEVSKLVITADSHTVSILQANLLDLRNAGSLKEIDFVITDSNSDLAKVSVQVTLAAPLN